MTFRALALLPLLLLLLAAGRAEAQSVRLSVESREIYADLPFVLAVTAEGFDEEPPPTISDLEIAGARVSFLGVSPSVRQSISIVNGRRTERREVTFVYRYRVEVPQPGSYQIEPVTVEQGGASARSEAQSFRADGIATTSDMRIDLTLPDRKVWVGEAFEATVDWYLRRDPRDQSFVVPLFQHDAFEVEEPAEAGGPTLDFAAGSRDLSLPYEREAVTVDGVEYTRFRFRALVRPTAPGRHELEPPRVVARLQTGAGRDAFGFRSPRFGLFKATGEARSIEIAPLPLAGRPTSFAGAVGDNFALEVSASRTVVSVGEPIELSILVRSTSDLEGLRLPPLRDAGLPESFAVADELPPGEPTGDGRGKRFRVVVRLTEPGVREIPALSFSYFDPATSEYRTARSEPIALSVDGSAVVGAGQVVGRRSGGSDDPAEASGGAAGVGAELALSEAGETLRPAWSVARMTPLLAALYLLPLAVLGFRVWQRRSAGRRGVSGAVKSAHREVEALLSRAGTEPARQSGPELVSALKALARASGSSVDPELVAHVETAAFDPRAADRPLDEGTRGRIRDAAASLARAGRASARRAPGAAAVGLVLLSAATAQAEPGAPALEEARARYQAALSEPERQARTRAFARAEAAFRALASAQPDRPELLTDWGNAALGAGDRGRAVLAYRRALALDPGLDRARRNLGWARERMPTWLPVAESSGAVDSFFFWHHGWSAPLRHLIAALAFAAAILLVAPWPTRRPRALRGAAALPAIVCLAMWASLLLEPDRSGDVVLLSGAPLRSADSDGAPAVLQQPLPAGAEASLRETRGSWARVVLPDGTDGWVPASSLARVSER